LIPKRRGKKRGAGRGGRRGWWLAVGVLAAAVVTVGAYLFDELPAPTSGVTAAVPPSIGAELEVLLGPLDPAGVRVQVADGKAARALARRLATAAAAWPRDVSLAPWSQTAQALVGEVVVAGRRYPLRLAWSAPLVEAAARLAVVIDDMGRNLERERAFLNLPLVITPSLLPYLPHSRELAALAREQGREFLLHLPMQPRGYPQQNPGKGALLEGMSEDQVRGAVRALLRAVPGAAGANNHMGSRFTELRKPMTWVLQELRGEGLYFLDSVTSGESVGAERARELGMGWARRDVFLDNEQQVAAVGAQLDKAAALARERGAAVAIGHPHAATLQALEQWAPKLRAAGVQVVPLGRLIHHGDGV